LLSKKIARDDASYEARIFDKLFNDFRQVQRLTGGRDTHQSVVRTEYTIDAYDHVMMQ